MSEGPAESFEKTAALSASVRVTAGSLLRTAREREGLHIAALAVSMKVPVKKLEALESDRLDLLPDAVFVRALAASVCRSLKIDAAPVLELLPASAPTRLNADDRGINTPFDVPGQASNTSFRSLLLTPPALMVLVLTVAALGVYFYPVASKDATVSDKLEAVAQAVTPEVIPEVVEPVLPLRESGVIPTETSASLSAPVNAPSSLVESPPANLTASTVALTPVPITAPVAQISEAQKTTPSAVSTNTSSVLQFKAKGIAWVQVTDAKGVQLLSRTLQTGEVIGVAGALPLAVVVGRVDLTSVELHGKPYDLGAVAQNNVARFEVKQ